MKKTPKSQKILVAMFDLCSGQPKALVYEDIVVAAFKKYPEDFQLRGYPQYPDSSDVHKPLYGDLKKKGLVRNADKTFELTEYGLDIARQVLRLEADDKNRLSRQEEHEINRILNSAALRLFAQNQSHSILDTDFFEYLGVTARTDKNVFMGRLNVVEQAVRAHMTKRNETLSEALQQLHSFLLNRFANDIEAIKARR